MGNVNQKTAHSFRNDFSRKRKEENFERNDSPERKKVRSNFSKDINLFKRKTKNNEIISKGIFYFRQSENVVEYSLNNHSVIKCTLSSGINANQKITNKVSSYRIATWGHQNDLSSISKQQNLLRNSSLNLKSALKFGDKLLTNSLCSFENLIIHQIPEKLKKCSLLAQETKGKIFARRRVKLHRIKQKSKNKPWISQQCSWPIPYLIALFLPEFPIRTILTENDFVILNEIGAGSFGKVYRVHLKSDSLALYAMKIQEKSVILNKNAVSQIKNEICIHRYLSGPFFISKFHTNWQSRSHLYTILEYALGYGDLFSFWRDYGPFNETLIGIFAAEIAIALDYVHKHNIVYRDLKMENIVLDLNGHIQLIDFGFAKRILDSERTFTICGTLQYMSPEIAAQSGYGKEVDWWAFGILLYILYFGYYPFPNSSVKSHTDLRFSDLNTLDCEESFGDLLKKLLLLDSKARIKSFAELQTHNFFANIDWDDIINKKSDPLHYIHNIGECTNYYSSSEQNELESNGTVFAHWRKFNENFEFIDADSRFPSFIDRS